METGIIFYWGPSSSSVKSKGVKGRRKVGRQVLSLDPASVLWSSGARPVGRVGHDVVKASLGAPPQASFWHPVSLSLIKHPGKSHAARTDGGKRRKRQAAVLKGGLLTLLLSCGRRERGENRRRGGVGEEDREGESEDSGADFWFSFEAQGE